MSISEQPFPPGTWWLVLCRRFLLLSGSLSVELMLQPLSLCFQLRNALAKVLCIFRKQALLELSLKMTDLEQGLIERLLNLRELLIALAEITQHLADRHEFGFWRGWRSVACLPDSTELVGERINVSTMKQHALAKPTGPEPRIGFAAIAMDLTCRDLEEVGRFLHRNILLVFHSRYGMGQVATRQSPMRKASIKLVRCLWHQRLLPAVVLRALRITRSVSGVRDMSGPSWRCATCQDGPGGARA